MMSRRDGDFLLQRRVFFITCRPDGPPNGSSGRAKKYRPLKASSTVNRLRVRVSVTSQLMRAWISSCVTMEPGFPPLLPVVPPLGAACMNPLHVFTAEPRRCQRSPYWLSFARSSIESIPGCLGPFEQQLIDESELFRARGGLRELFQHSTQVSRETGGLPQIADPAGARHAGQIGHALRNRHLIGKFAIERVFGEVDIGGTMGTLSDRALRDVRALERAEIGNSIAIGKRLIVLDRADVD